MMAQQNSLAVPGKGEALSLDLYQYPCSHAGNILKGLTGFKEVYSALWKSSSIRSVG